MDCSTSCREAARLVNKKTEDVEKTIKENDEVDKKFNTFKSKVDSFKVLSDKSTEVDKLNEEQQIELKSIGVGLKELQGALEKYRKSYFKLFFGWLLKTKKHQAYKGSSAKIVDLLSKHSKLENQGDTPKKLETEEKNVQDVIDQKSEQLDSRKESIKKRKEGVDKLKEEVEEVKKELSKDDSFGL